LLRHLHSFPTRRSSDLGALGDAIVEHAARVVGLLRQPVHARRAGRFGLGVDVLDQRSADTAAANAFRDEEILQVAVITAGPAAADRKSTRLNSSHVKIS